jgi:hypothetical protein
MAAAGHLRNVDNEVRGLLPRLGAWPVQVAPGVILVPLECPLQS